ncbi:MAG: hypothetical protein IT462_11670 [Planctomycetes bacterium]|nr:hypothetical protein [Planctomycetota bacterium]
MRYRRRQFHWSPAETAMCVIGAILVILSSHIGRALVPVLGWQSAGLDDGTTALIGLAAIALVAIPLGIWWFFWKFAR